MTVLQEIESKALSLSSNEKGQLIHDLIIAMDGESRFSGDYEREIQERIQKINSGHAIGTTASEVFSKIEATHR